MNIEVLAKEFYEHSLYFRGYSKATIRRYRHAINLYRTFANIIDIEQVTGENIRALFLYGRTQRNWKSATFITHYKSLVVFFRWCKERGYPVSASVEDIEKPKLEHRLPPKLTRQEALRLLEIVYNLPYSNKFIQYRNHAIFSIFIFAGLRKNELLQLRYTDVDIQNQTLFVSQGKGSKDRIIPIGSTLAHSLERYLLERRKMNKSCPDFFTSFGRNDGLAEISLKRLVEKIRIASGIVFTIHKLRHTFATLMLEGGCDIYSLSRIMGHTDIKTTTIYLAASAEHLRSQIMKHPLNSSI